MPLLQEENEMFEKRDGEEALTEDPATVRPHGHVVFIGHIRSPWTRREDCPKNMTAAREKGGGGLLEIDAQFRRGLLGLEGVSHLVILSWLHHAPRNLIVQKPRHALAAKGVFALRSPARPNPVGLHIARLVSLDPAVGTVTLDAIDVLDGTPIIDLKPYIPAIDAFPDAVLQQRKDER